MDQLLIPDEMADGFEDGPVLTAECKVVVANAVAHILRAVGEDLQREGLRDTPARGWGGINSRGGRRSCGAFGSRPGR